jgi:phage terminase small subunit
MSTELNPREEQFCLEYLIDRNATQAALRAGYAESTAKDACKWIQEKNPKKPYLKKRIDEMKGKLSQRAEITVADVLGELAKIAMADVEVTERGKMKALELIGKYFGMFTANADNSDTLAKLDEVLGRIEGEI